MHALGRPAAFRNIVDLKMVHAALVREEAEVLVVGRCQKFQHIVVIRRIEAGDAFAAPVLLMVVFKAGALDIAAPGQGDHDLVIGDQILDIYAAGLVSHNLAEPGRGIGGTDVLYFVADDAAQNFGIGKDGLEVGDIFQQFLVLILDFLALQAGQALQAHVKDGLGLHLVKPEAGHEVRPGLVRALCRTDKGNNFVNIVDGRAQALKDMGPGFRLVQIIARAADNNLAPEIQEGGESRLQVEQDRPVVHHGQHVDAEAGFKAGVLVEVLDNDIGNDAAAQVHHDADAAPVRFVTQIDNAVYLALVDQLGNLFHQDGLVYAIRYFRDDKGLGVLVPVLYLDTAADFYRPASGMVRIAQALAREDYALCGKVRPLHHVHQLADSGIGIVDQHGHCIAQLAKIVRGNVGCHADGNAGRAVEQKVGHL